MSEHPVVDVTIIGAGPAGLAAAYYAAIARRVARIIRASSNSAVAVAAVYPEKHIFCEHRRLPKDQRPGSTSTAWSSRAFQYGAEALLSEGRRDARARRLATTREL